MLRTLLRLAARLPLSGLHGIGAALGWLVYICSPAYSRRLRENLQSSEISSPQDLSRLRHLVVAETGKGAVELAALWFAPDAAIQRWAHCETWAVVEQARKPGQGIIFLTPHLGGFEICAQYISQRMPITVLYRPPKLRWLEPLMIGGRSRWQTKVAPANLRGVRLFIKALRNGDALSSVRRWKPPSRRLPAREPPSPKWISRPSRRAASRCKRRCWSPRSRKIFSTRSAHWPTNGCCC